jgi:hypothetical protein
MSAVSNEIAVTIVDANHPRLQGLQSLFGQLHLRLPERSRYLSTFSLQNRYFSIVCDHDFFGFDIVDIRSCSRTIFRILNRSLRKNIATRGVGYATVDTAYHSAFLDTEIKECAYCSHIGSKSIKHLGRFLRNFDLRPARHPLMRLTILILKCIRASRFPLRSFSLGCFCASMFSENIDIFRLNDRDLLRAILVVDPRPGVLCWRLPGFSRCDGKIPDLLF